MFVPLRKSILPNPDNLSPYLEEIKKNKIYSNNGPLVKRFENALAKQYAVSAENVLSVSSATMGLSLVLSYFASHQNTGGACVIPDFTFPAVGNIANNSRYYPLICDVNEHTWQLEPTTILKNNKHKIGAVMPVSCFGAPVDIESWVKFKNDTGIPVVLDNAWSFDTLIPSELPALRALLMISSFK